FQGRSIASQGDHPPCQPPMKWAYTRSYPQSPGFNQCHLAASQERPRPTRFPWDAAWDAFLEVITMTKPTPRLTAAFVNKTHAPEGTLTDQLFYDDGDEHRGIPGFALRVRAGGSRNWVFTYKIGGKTKRITFGEASAMSPPAARAQAEKF